ncbi:hypothetical protein PENSPDRAFT_683372 [Peniophora sp. CONT]|nr:hypothetical protein PENSPDRAFT_683372 [Peniophora sp. CONT]
MFNVLSLVVVAIAAVSAFATPAGELVRRQTITGGEATFYFQGGVAGACGKVFPDSALIVAEQAGRFKASDCGRKVRITNTQNGKTVTATVEDKCPGCQGNPNSLDLSKAAFDAIASEAQGVVPISWVYLS